MIATNIMRWYLLILFGIQNIWIRQVECVRCFECNNYPSPALCTDITTCRDDEDCFVQQIVTTGGRVVFSSGCISKDRCAAISGQAAAFVGKRGFDDEKRNTDITTCEECCHGNLCNNKGCSKSDIPREKRGPYCYTCDLMNSPDDCDKVTICGTDQQCLVHVPSEFRAFPVPVYRAECESNGACGALPPGAGPCPATCCNTDFCNDHCNGTAPSPLQTTTSGTAAPSTPTTTEKVEITTTNRLTTTMEKVEITTMIRPTTTTEKATTTSPTELTVRTTTETTTVDNSPRCESPFHHVPHTKLCIDIHEHAKSWTDARKDCQKDNADLLMLKTDHDREHLYTYVRDHVHNHDDDYWIGLYDRQDQAYNYDHFTFVDGDSIRNTMWTVGQPSGGDQNCVRIVGRDQFRWADSWCHRLFDVKDYWIGIYDQKLDDHFTFVNGHSIHYTMWRHGDPDEHGDENCVRIVAHRDQFLWADCHCLRQYDYICQK